MAPVEPGSKAAQSFPIEALRAKKHQVINALEHVKLNGKVPVDRITQAQQQLQNMSLETSENKIRNIVNEAVDRQLLPEEAREPFHPKKESFTMQNTNLWTVIAIVVVIAVAGYIFFGGRGGNNANNTVNIPPMPSPPPVPPLSPMSPKM